VAVGNYELSDGATIKATEASDKADAGREKAADGDKAAGEKQK
jgi:hypothetical protein